MSKPLPLDLEINIKPKLTLKWKKKEDFLHFKKGYEKGFEKAQEIIKEEVKQRIKSACEFYLRYKDKPNDLLIDFPKFIKNVNNIRLRFVDKNGDLVGSMIWHYLSDYNEWLFKLAFKGVFENETRTFGFR